MRVAPPSLELYPGIDSGLPHYSPANLRVIKAANFLRVGVVAAVIGPDDRLLMLHHKPSEKVGPDGAWGPLAETSHIARRDNSYIVESIAATLYRSFSEELGIGADFLGLSLPPASIGSFTTCRWPIGHGHEGYAFGVVPFVYLASHEVVQRHTANFSPTNEIDGAEFMTPNEIRSQGQGYLREGVLDWLAVVEKSASYGLPEPLVKIHRPLRFDGPGQDLIFADLTL